MQTIDSVHCTMFQDRKTKGCGLTTFTIMVMVGGITSNHMLGHTLG